MQQDADALLAESELIPRLRKYGHVTVVGSYSYQLMTVRDIDVYVIDSQAGRDQAKDILCDLIDQAYWRSFLFGDWIQFQHDGFPCGIYIGLKRRFRGELWKVDIWNMTDISSDLVSFNDAMSKLTETQRTTIMHIKHWRNSSAQNISSKLIYDAVLQERAHDVESFKLLLEE